MFRGPELYHLMSIFLVTELSEFRCTCFPKLLVSLNKQLDSVLSSVFPQAADIIFHHVLIILQQE